MLSWFCIFYKFRTETQKTENNPDIIWADVLLVWKMLLMYSTWFTCHGFVGKMPTVRMWYCSSLHTSKIFCRCRTLNTPQISGILCWSKADFLYDICLHSSFSLTDGRKSDMPSFGFRMMWTVEVIPTAGWIGLGVLVSQARGDENE